MIGSQCCATNTSNFSNKPFSLKETWGPKSMPGEVTMDGTACAKALRQKERWEVGASGSVGVFGYVSRSRNAGAHRAIPSYQEAFNRVRGR